MNRRKFFGCFAFLPFVGAKPTTTINLEQAIEKQLMQAKLKLAERKRSAAMRSDERGAWAKLDELRIKVRESEKALKDSLKKLDS